MPPQNATRSRWSAHGRLVGSISLRPRAQGPGPKSSASDCATAATPCCLLHRQYAVSGSGEHAVSARPERLVFHPAAMKTDVLRDAVLVLRHLLPPVDAPADAPVNGHAVGGVHVGFLVSRGKVPLVRVAGHVTRPPSG